MEARFRSLEPRTGSLEEMVTSVERAYKAADRLSVDIETLEEASVRIDKMEKDATKD